MRLRKKSAPTIRLGGKKRHLKYDLRALELMRERFLQLEQGGFRIA